MTMTIIYLKGTVMFTEQQYYAIKEILIRYTMPKDQLGFESLDDIIRMIDNALNQQRI